MIKSAIQFIESKHSERKVNHFQLLDRPLISIYLVLTASINSNLYNNFLDNISCVTKHGKKKFFREFIPLFFLFREKDNETTFFFLSANQTRPQKIGPGHSPYLSLIHG